MKQTAKRMMIVLVIAMIINILAITAVADEPSQLNPTRDVLLVLDCSGSMVRTDPNKLCATACELLVDQMPLQNARIGIIAYGYNGGTPYQMKHYEVKKGAELNLVNVVTPLTETVTVKGIANLKDTIETVTEMQSNTTPTGTALISAVDLLTESGATDDNACIVLLSDGESITQHSNFTDDVQYGKDATEIAKSHGWPIFALQMNERDQNGATSPKTEHMRHYATQSGAVAPGLKNEDYCYYNLTSFEQGNFAVSVAMSNIFAWVANNFPPPEPKEYTLPADIPYDVPNLASEFNITVLGSSLKNVTLTYPDNTKKEITANITKDPNLLASIVPGRYYNVKLFCPPEGSYSLHVDGEGSGDDVAISFDVSTMDMDLALNSNPALSTENSLNKNTTITFTSNLYYRDIDILDNRYYEEKQPDLEIIGTGGTKTIHMTGSKEKGYSASVAVSELTDYGQSFEVRARLDDEMFKLGRKYSNSLYFKTENLLPTIINPDVPSLTAGINSTFEKIDLREYINNPDNDKHDVVLECIGDRSVVFDYTYDHDYLEIASGLVPGAYEMQLKVKDADMPDYLVLNPFTLTVTESPFTYEEIDDVKVWYDSYPWQEAGASEASISLSDYYSDPDGLAPVFSNVTFDGEGTVFNCEQSGTILKFTPVAKGDGSVSFTVSDQMTEQNVSFDIEVISGKAAFWAKNWIWGVLIAGIIVFLVILIIAFQQNTRVKGTWNFTFEEDNNGYAEAPGVNIHASIPVAKNKSFKMSELFDEVTKYIPEESDPNGIRVHVESYFRGNGAEKIILKGVLGKSGFKIMHIPQNNLVKITAAGSGTSYRKTVKVGRGKVKIALTKLDPNGSPQSLYITMRSN